MTESYQEMNISEWTSSLREGTPIQTSIVVDEKDMQIVAEVNKLASPRLCFAYFPWSTPEWTRARYDPFRAGYASRHGASSPTFTSRYVRKCDLGVAYKGKYISGLFIGKNDQFFFIFHWKFKIGVHKILQCSLNSGEICDHMVDWN